MTASTKLAAGLRLWTVNVSGEERHDGEKPYSYVLHAETMTEAKMWAWLHHVWTNIAERGIVSADGTLITDHGEEITATAFAGSVTDVVVIDCDEFPCVEGAPFECTDPVHFEERVWQSTTCRCDWHWNAVTLLPSGDIPIDLTELIAIDLLQLADLGYKLPLVAPEENQW